MLLLGSRYIDFLIIIITYLYSTCISSFFVVHFKNVFFILVCVIFVQYSKCCSKNIRDRSKIEITQTWRYYYIDKNVRRMCARESPEISTCEVPRDVARKLQLTLCPILASYSRRGKLTAYGETSI